MTYDPNSNDALFSRMNQRLDTQDSTLSTILSEVKSLRSDMQATIAPIDKRVTALETAGAVTRGKVTAVSALVSGVVGIVGWLLTRQQK